jgi:hypothetical protein
MAFGNWTTPFAMQLLAISVFVLLMCVCVAAVKRQ